MWLCLFIFEKSWTNQDIHLCDCASTLSLIIWWKQEARKGMNCTVSFKLFYFKAIFVFFFSHFWHFCCCNFHHFWKTCHHFSPGLNLSFFSIISRMIFSWSIYLVGWKWANILCKHPEGSAGYNTHRLKSRIFRCFIQVN